MPCPPDPRVRRATQEGTLSHPTLFIPGQGRQANFYAGAQAYRNRRLRTLTKSLIDLGSAFGKSAFPGYAAHIEGAAIIAGGVVDVWGILQDGKISAGETIDLARFGVAGLGAVRAMGGLGGAASSSVSGTASDVPDGLRQTDLALGVIAKTRKGYLKSIVVPSSYDIVAAGRDKTLADIRKAMGPGAGLVGSALDALDVVLDPYVWADIDQARDPLLVADKLTFLNPSKTEAA